MEQPRWASPSAIGIVMFSNRPPPPARKKNKQLYHGETSTLTSALVPMLWSSDSNIWWEITYPENTRGRVEWRRNKHRPKRWCRLLFPVETNPRVVSAWPLCWQQFPYRTNFWAETTIAPTSQCSEGDLVPFLFFLVIFFWWFYNFCCPLSLPTCALYDLWLTVLSHSQRNEDRITDQKYDSLFVSNITNLSWLFPPFLVLNVWLLTFRRESLFLSAR